MRRKQKRKNQPLKKKTKTNRCPYSQVKKGYEEDVMSFVKCWNCQVRWQLKIEHWIQHPRGHWWPWWKLCWWDDGANSSLEGVVSKMEGKKLETRINDSWRFLLQKEENIRLVVHGGTGVKMTLFCCFFICCYFRYIKQQKVSLPVVLIWWRANNDFKGKIARMLMLSRWKKIGSTGEDVLF